jgi:phosphoinositide-3-kinase regulatory subunit 4
MAVAIAQVASQRHYCLSLHPIIVRPTARQMRRLALRYLYPDVAGRERRPQQSIGRAVSIVESTDGAVTGLLAPYDPAAGSDTPHEETFPRCFSEASLAPERPVSGFTAACPRYPGSPALKPAASPSFAQGPASTTSVDKCQTPLAPPAASHLNSVRPSSPLLCQAKEHDGAVLDSAAHELLPIFLTAGADGTLRLWDLRQLDNESALVSRKVYSTQSTPARRMLSCCLQSSLASSAAAGNDEGAFSLFDLSTGTELYRQIVGGGVGGGVSCIRRVTGCDTFLCGSHHGIVCAVDPRVARGEVWSSPPDTRQGPLTGLVLGDESGRGCAVWMVTATLRGHATLWDLRFRIPVYTWQHPQDSPALYALGLCGPAPTVLMAANNNEVPRWNLESLRCQAIYKASPASPSGSDPRDARRSSPAPSSSTTNPFCPPLTSATHTHSIRAICGFRDCNWFITGGTDRKIRFWDTSNPCHSYTVSGLEPGEPQPKFQETRVQGTTEIREQPLQVGEEDLRKARGQHPTSTLNRNVTAHKDCITSLTLVCPMPQTNIPLLASSSRDGVVKIWQNRVMQMQDRR